jgi:hypothetical protein
MSASIADEFGREGVTFFPANKADRVSGWEVLRRLMQDAGTDKAGFYASRACEYFWQTTPYLGRDPRKPNDCDSCYGVRTAQRNGSSEEAQGSAAHLRQVSLPLGTAHPLLLGNYFFAGWAFECRLLGILASNSKDPRTKDPAART